MQTRKISPVDGFTSAARRPRKGKGRGAPRFTLKPLPLACMLACLWGTQAHATCSAATATDLVNCITGGDTDIQLTANINVTAGTPALGAGVVVSTNSHNLSGVGLTGAGSISQTTASSANLANDNSNTGTTTIGAASSLSVGFGASGSLGSGAVSNAGTLLFVRSGTVTVGNNISGAGAVTFLATGTTILTGTNTYSGATGLINGTLQAGADNVFSPNSFLNLSSGTLDLNGHTETAAGMGSGASVIVSLGSGGKLILNDAGTGIFRGTISGAGSLESASGSIALLGANTYSAGTKIDSGASIILQTNGATGGDLGTGAVVNNGGLSFQRTDNHTFANDISGTGNLSSGASGSTGTAILTGNISTTGSATANSGVLQFGDGSTAGSLGAATSLTINTPGAIAFDHSDNITVANTITGSGTLQQLGTGTLTLNHANTAYTGTVDVENGTVKQGVSGALGSTVVNALVKGSGVLDLNNLATSLGTLSGNGTVNLGTAVLTVGSAVNSSFSGTITGTGTLRKSGTSTLTITGNNSFGGTLQVAAGTLQLGNGASNGALTAGAPINVSGGATLLFNEAGAVVVGNQITGGGAVEQKGPGMVTLTGANNYTGSTTIDAGSTLQVGNGGSSGTLGTGAVVNNGSLVLNRSDVRTVANAISGSGGVTVTGNGFLTLSGANTYSGDTSLQSGTLQALGANTLSSNSVMVLAASTVLDVNNSAQTVAGLQGSGAVGTGSTSGVLTINTASGTSYDYSGSISGGGSLVKSGAGTQRLSGNNIYSGGTTISNGTLEVTNGNALGSAGGMLNLSGGGALLATGPISLTTGALTVGAGGGKIAAAGGATLNYGNTGGFSVGAGNLVFGDAVNNGTVALSLTGGGSVNAGASIEVAGGTLRDGNGAFGSSASIVSAFTVDANATYDMNNNSTSFKNLQGAGTVSTGSSSLTNITVTDGNFGGSISGGGNLVKSGSGTLVVSNINLSGSTTINAGGTLQVGNGGAASISTSSISNSGALVFNSGATVNVNTGISGGGTFTQNGSGSVVLNNGTSYSGDTTINAGTLRAGNAGVFSNFSNVNLAAGGTTLDLGGLDQGINSLSGVAGSTVALGSGNLTVGANLGGGGNFAGNITGGSGGVTFNGLGTQVLSGSSSYSGATGVSNGTLQAGAVNTFAQNSAYTVGNGATLDLNGRDNTIGSLAGGAAANLSLGGARLTAGGDNTDTSFNGNITDTGGGGLTKAGSGTLTLGGFSNYNGGTRLTGGTLALAGANAMGGGTITFSGGGLRSSLSLNLSNAVAFDAGVNGNIAASAGNTLTFNGGGLTLGSGASASFGDATNTGTVALAAPLTLDASNSLTITGGTLELRSDPNIAGAITNNALLRFAGSGTSTISGAIGGSGDLAVQSGTVTLTGANNYAGATNITGGTLRIGDGTAGGDAGVLGAGAITNNGTLQISRTNAYTLSSAISGSGGLTVDGGGNLTLTGASNYSGATSVNAGTLSVNGSITSATTVNNGGTLGGNGSLGPVTIMSGGTLSPGNSIGTLNVAGPLVFNAGSNYNVQTDAAGNADRTNVTGSITINGGTVNVQAGAGNYARNTSYTILTSTTGTTGTFAGTTSNLAFLTPTLSYQANAVLLNLQSSNAAANYASVAGSGNQASVANYLNGFSNNPGNPQAAALIQQIDNLTAGQARTAFESMSGSQIVAGSRIAGSLGQGYSSALFGRARSAGGAEGGPFGALSGARFAALEGSSFASPWGLRSDTPYQLAGAYAPGVGGAPPANMPLYGDTGVATSGDSGWAAAANAAGQGGLWAQALGGGGRTASDGNGPGSSYRAGGFMAGYDYAVSPQWLLGVSGGYTRTTWNASTNGVAPANGNIDTPMGALYARYSSGPWQLRFNTTYADHDLSASRSVTIGAATSNAVSTHHGREWGVASEVEYAIAAGGWQLRPLASLRYARLGEDGFSESGAGASNLTVAARNTQSTVLGAGARALYAFNHGSTGVELRAVASHTFGDVDSPISARLAGQPNSFTSNGTPLKRDAVTLGAALSAQLGQRLTGFVDVSAEQRGSGQSAYALAAGLRYIW